MVHHGSSKAFGSVAAPPRGDGWCGASGEKWECLMESVDLLFSKVAEIDRSQQQINANFDLSAQVMERVLQDQQTLTKQMEITGQAVVPLTLDRPPSC